ncbi:MAG: hypothetical protein M1444_04580 [Patescibacteria group bacterium]|nr:hypothetical protein [Patescibacteria group bacterium]
MANEAVPADSALEQEVILEQNGLTRLACKLVILAGAGLYIEGAINNAPSDSIAGVAAASIAVVVYLRHPDKPSQNTPNS